MKGLLKDQVAVVTGGSAGIGRAIAKMFVEQGATVCIMSMTPEKGLKAVQDILAEVPEGQCEFIQVDVADSASVHKAFDQVIGKHGHIDVLVNNAGITRDGLLMKMAEDDWDRVMNVNAKSCFNACHAVVRSMMRARKGKIINITSVVGLTGNAGQVNYAASKAAIIGFTKSLAKELAPRQIKANCIAPGYIETDMTNGLSEGVKKDLMTKIPLERLGLPDDIARVALFLASPLSDYMTGQVLVVDGGMVM